MSYATARWRGTNSEMNKLYPEDRGVHEWYRFVLSFPPHLVRTYLERFDIGPGHCVLDPFCGTGTVLVEAKKRGIPSVGIEANPLAHFASCVKVDWTPDPDRLLDHARHIAAAAAQVLQANGIEDVPFFQDVRPTHDALRALPLETSALLLQGSISPLPLHKTLVLLDCLEQHRDERYVHHERLALAKTLVYSSSNLHFGPEVGVGPARDDAPVIAPWLASITAMANDLRRVQASVVSEGFV